MQKNEQDYFNVNCYANDVMTEVLDKYGPDTEKAAWVISAIASKLIDGSAVMRKITQRGVVENVKIP